MTDAAETAPAEMPRPVRLDRLARTGPKPFDETATEAERAAIARLLGVRSVDRFRFRGQLVPMGDEGWRLEGRLTATVVQPCVVTLEDVAQRMDETVRRQYLPGAEETLDVDPDRPEEEEVDPLPRLLDLGAVAIETASLALDPWPRKPDAALPGDAAGDGSDEARPFAALAALRKPSPEEG
jgi:uncharacterized metal-binding protein YceD (DUF177 family)